MPVLVACCGLAATVALGLWTAERSHGRALDQERTQTAAALEQAKLQIQDLAGCGKKGPAQGRAVTSFCRIEGAPVLK